MRSNLLILALTLLSCSLASAQPTRRLAVVEGNGQTARSNPAIATAENQLTDRVTGKLTGRPGITVIDRASIDKIIKEQNFQNSDRSSSDTAVRIGKLLGAGQIVLVNVYDASFTTHSDTSGSTTKTMGTQTLRANARLIEVETGAILASPESEFQDSVLVSEVSKSNGYQIGGFHVPGKNSATGGDPTVIQGNEWAKASDTVSTDLAAKLLGAVSSGSSAAPMAAATPAISALVAGIANGSVYINQGSSAGVKVSEKFQVTREVPLGFNDPGTGKPMTQKSNVCILTIVQVDENSASGTCQGGVPQARDIVQTMK